MRALLPRPRLCGEHNRTFERLPDLLTLSTGQGLSWLGRTETGDNPAERRGGGDYAPDSTTVELAPSNTGVDNYSDPFGLCSEEDKKAGNCTQPGVGPTDIRGFGRQQVIAAAVARGQADIKVLAPAIITAGARTLISAWP